jgi:hypothetical protein
MAAAALANILTGTPPDHWIAIVGQIVRQDGLSLIVAAEGYAQGRHIARPLLYTGDVYRR